MLTKEDLSKEGKFRLTGRRKSRHGFHSLWPFSMVLVIIARLIHPITSLYLYHHSEVISRAIQDRLFPAKNEPRVVVMDVATEQSHTHLHRPLPPEDASPAECPAQTTFTCLLGRDDFSASKQNMLMVPCSLKMKAHSK